MIARYAILLASPKIGPTNFSVPKVASFLGVLKSQFRVS